MKQFLTRRLVICAATIAGASFLIFAGLYLAPGDPISFLIGGRPSTPEMREALADQYHLNDPFFQRYLQWLGDAFAGDFGESIVRRRPVTELIATSLPTTILLVLMTLLLVVLIGVLLGGIAAFRRGPIDDGILSAMTVSLATPVFVSAILLISVFAVGLGWFPVFGPGTDFLDRLHHLVLPAIALTIAWWPVIGETARASMREEHGREHVETARSRGLSPSHIVRKHVFRNSAIPISTVVGLSFAGLVAGTAIVESAFQLNGLGSLLITSVTGRDFPVAQAVALILVTVFAVTNVIVDLLYAALDPRVRTSWRTA
ncbi:ABC transporter permease [Agromyces endophyticus]|uniref:ABC transporter permease n=1 Tax=Agromyces sp. H17E-10 TaxID=2932244 RepID=UPI001FD12C62|nr:ABC transporter permease [Agromyces sp. H17E-10]UOQ89186.1 ABC transporter permease [Agromyces sp. H17E-10]